MDNIKRLVRAMTRARDHSDAGINPCARDPQADTRRRPRRTARNAGIGLFVAVHVGAAVSLYSIALSLGGGRAATPFPPDVRLPSVRSVALAAPIPSRPARDPQSAAEDRHPVYPATVEIAAPWIVDADGRVHLRNAQ